MFNPFVGLAGDYSQPSISISVTGTNHRLDNQHGSGTECGLKSFFHLFFRSCCFPLAGQVAMQCSVCLCLVSAGHRRTRQVFSVLASAVMGIVTLMLVISCRRRHDEGLTASCIQTQWQYLVRRTRGTREMAPCQHWTSQHSSRIESRTMQKAAHRPRQSWLKWILCHFCIFLISDRTSDVEK